MSAPKVTLLQSLEATLIAGFIRLVRWMDVERASDLFGVLARILGPLLPVNKVGDANLRLAMPELDAAARRRILRGVWDNLGRTVAEFPHLGELNETTSGPGFEVVNRHMMLDLAAGGAPAVVVGGHLANWEVGPLVMTRLGMRMGFFYRAASNPAVDAMILDLREQANRGVFPGYPKGGAGARQAVAFLMRGGHLGMLVDQKLNNGIAVPFFGHPAMTAPAAATFALRLKAKIIPAHVQRIGRVRYRATFELPLELPSTGNREQDVAAMTLAINQRLEAWIRQAPEQWLWLHRRWPKEATHAIP